MRRPFATFRHTLLRTLALIVVFTIASTQTAFAATLTFVSDELTRHLLNTVSNHTITFVTPSGIDAPTDTISYTLNAFDVSGVSIGDLDFTYGTGTGFENVAPLAGVPGAGVWGASIAGQTITVTAPTDASTSTIVASSTVRLLIGTHAIGGSGQIINPGTAGNFEGQIGGSFGDVGIFGIPIVNDDGVAVTAQIIPPYVPPPSGGGGSGQVADNTPPTIFNIQTSTTSDTTVRITWQTDENSSSEVAYGHSLSYASGTESDLTQVLFHTIDLSGLIPCHTYVFEVASIDGALNAASVGGNTFTMPCDSAPPIISNVRAENITDTSAIILWETNEPATSLTLYGGTVSYGFQGTAVGFVTNHAIPIAGLAPGTLYHFLVRSADGYTNEATSGDYTFITLSDSTPPTNATLTAIPGDGEVSLSWTLPTDPDLAGIRVIRRDDRFPVNQFDGTLVYTGLATTHLDIGLTNGTTYYYGAYAFDTNGNHASGAIDDATPNGVVPPPLPPPTSTPPVVPPTSTSPTPPVTPPSTGTTSTPPTTGPTTPGATMVVHLFGSGGTLPLIEDGSGEIGVRAQSTMFISVPASSMNGTPDIVTFTLGEARYQLQYNPSSNAYEGTAPAPISGTLSGFGEAHFNDGRIARDPLVVRAEGVGQVVERTIIGDSTDAVGGATVTIYREEAGVWTPFNASQYAQQNPITTNENGAFVFEVPPGRYYVEVEKEGYRERVTTPVFIDGNVYNERVELIAIPRTLEDVVDQIIAVPATATPIEFAVDVAEVVGDNISYQVQQLQERIESASVQQANTRVVSPAALTVTVLNAASAFSLFNLLAYAQYLFTQPLLLLWRRKRKEYGLVYNALTKRPIDLAIVRLVHAESGLTVQTRVTDSLGRFIIKVRPGSYKLEVVKPNYLFPTHYLAGKAVDVDFVDLYHGESMKIDEELILTPNIPLDPVLIEDTPRQILFRKFLRNSQHAIAFSGVIISTIAFAITPSVGMAFFILSQVIIFYLFRRLVMPRAPKNWGTVIDASTKKPIGRAVVRLFDSKFNRLLDTQVADSRGRYGFLVGKNVYYLTGAAKGYEVERLSNIDLTTKAEGVVGKNIHLKKVDT